MGKTYEKPNGGRSYSFLSLGRDWGRKPNCVAKLASGCWSAGLAVVGIPSVSSNVVQASGEVALLRAAVLLVGRRSLWGAVVGGSAGGFCRGRRRRQALGGGRGCSLGTQFWVEVED